ncbi:MAG TPA: hypothetical protein DIV41_07920 [Ruminococcaceae bacterium]|nr:hypothetical protein [Oscillospiraceae bacterium]
MEENRAWQVPGAWSSYYSETDPERRMEILCAGSEENPSDKLVPLRHALWELRYSDPQDPKHRVDQFLWQFVNILCVYRMSGSRFFQKKGEKEIRQIMETMGFSEAAGFGAEGERELYWEFRNAARRYFTACLNDKSYRKKYFGIAAMKQDETDKKLAGDAWKLSEGAAERFNLTDEIKPFTQAVRDEFFSIVPDASGLWEGYAEKNESGVSTVHSGVKQKGR